MILTLYTEDVVDAAHMLKGYDGKCSVLHGHTWKITVKVKGDESLRDETGILWDFGNLKKETSKMDHNNLNEVLQVNPTAENIALYLYRKFKKQSPDLLFNIRVYESAVLKEAWCETGDF